MKKFFEIVAYKDEQVVQSIEVTGKSERQIERIEDGANINLNHEDYYTRVREENE